MNKLKVFLITTFMFANSLAMGVEQKSRQAIELADRVMSEMHSWENKNLKFYLQHRMAENQHLLGVLKEFHVDLEQTELDSAYNYFVNSLIEDQKGLAFVSHNLNSVDSAEALNLDVFLSEKPNLKNEVDQALANKLRIDSGKRVVDRVLYYSLMEKYSVN